MQVMLMVVMQCAKHKIILRSFLSILLGYISEHLLLGDIIQRGGFSDRKNLVIHIIAIFSSWHVSSVLKKLFLNICGVLAVDIVMYVELNIGFIYIRHILNQLPKRRLFARHRFNDHGSHFENVKYVLWCSFSPPLRAVLNAGAGCFHRHRSYCE